MGGESKLQFRVSGSFSVVPHGWSAVEPFGANRERKMILCAEKCTQVYPFSIVTLILKLKLPALAVIDSLGLLFLTRLTGLEGAAKVRLNDGLARDGVRLVALCPTLVDQTEDETQDASASKKQPFWPPFTSGLSIVKCQGFEPGANFPFGR